MTFTTKSIGAPVFYQYDRTPPNATNSTNTDLSGWKRSGTVDTVVGSSDKGMGVKRVGITGGSNGSSDTITSACTGGILSTCPQSPPSQTFTTNLASTSVPEGIHQITGYAEDILGKRTNATTPLTVKIDRTAPELELGGTLAVAFSDPRFRGLYDAEYSLTVTARDDDSQRPESGAVSIRAELRRPDGSVVTSASTAQACAAGQNCALSLPQPYVVRTDDVPDGAYNVVVKAEDAAGNSTERIQDVIIDRRGDIYTARKLVTYVAEQEDDSRAVEWARVGTHDARVETEDHVSTRTTVADAGTQYDEVRYVSRNGQVRDPDTGELDSHAEESITVDKGAGTSDPELDIVADILQPAYDLAAGTIQTAGSGSLDQALTNGQAPPPNHGTTYTAYESEPTPFEDQHGPSAPHTVARVTVDTQTKMPIRQTVTNIDTNQLLLSIRYIYELDRLQSSEVDPAFFRESTPANVGTSEESQATGAQMPATIQDSDTGQTFVPYQLGLSFELGGLGIFLRTGSEIVNRTISGVTATGELEPDLQPEEQGSAIQATASTLVTAYYQRVESIVSQFVPGLPVSDAAMSVVSMHSSSSEARAWEAAYMEAIGGGPGSDPDRTGQVSLTINGVARIALVVPSPGARASALISLGDTTIILKADFTKQTLSTITNLLELA